MAKISPRAVGSSSMSSYLLMHASPGGRRLKRNIAHKNIQKHFTNGMLYSYSTPASAKEDNNYVSPYTAQPILSTSATPDLQNKTIQAQILAAERERIRAEFFATYDVMTGVRIAATLGGFFGLMVFLIVWKSRSSSNETLKVLKDPKMAAVAAVCMQEEEEREIQEAMVATGMSIFPDEYDTILYRRQRMLSLGNVSAPPMLNRGFRFSSIGGVGGPVPTNINTRPRRFSYSASSAADSLASGKRKSVSESTHILENFPMGGSFGNNDFLIETENDIEDAEGNAKNQTQRPARSDSTHSKGALLDVPTLGQDSRRSSSMTCCSTESSYSERRCSAFTLGLSNFPGSSTDNWDYVYPDIQVINATPKPSPCQIERLQNGQHKTKVMRKQSIAYCDPEKPQVGRCQQPHSISANIFDSNPLNKIKNQLQQQKQQQRPSIGVHQGFHSFDIAEVEEKQQRRRKISLIELKEHVGFQQRISPSPITTNTAHENNNNHSFPCQEISKTTTGGGGNSSSLSMDSTPLSIDQLNGSSSLGTVSVKALFNAEKRAPLASLSSFKISSIEYAESELQTHDEESVFLKHTGCDTDDDMQELSSDSEEVSFTGSRKKSKKRNFATEKQAQLLQKTPVSALLQRQRTTSASSSDRVLLLGQHLNVGVPSLDLETIAYRSPNQKHRGLLIQQFSDPKSQHTEEDTCSTLNTELCGTIDAAGGSGGAESSNTTLTQNSSLNTVLSFGKLSPTAEIMCASSTLSDSIMNTRHSSICMPDALKDAILRGSTTQDKKYYSSANLLELPLIKLSRGKGTENSPSESDENKSCDPSLPSSSRKWSKETLF